MRSFSFFLKITKEFISVIFNICLINLFLIHFSCNIPPQRANIIITISVIPQKSSYSGVRAPHHIRISGINRCLGEKRQHWAWTCSSCRKEFLFCVYLWHTVFIESKGRSFPSLFLLIFEFILTTFFQYPVNYYLIL